MGQEERRDVLNTAFWYFLNAVMQNAAYKMMLSMRLKEIKDRLLERFLG